MTNTLKDAAILAGLNEDQLAVFGVTIVSYIDSDGDEMFAFATHGEALRSSMVGLLSMVQNWMMNDDSLLE